MVAPRQTGQTAPWRAPRTSTGSVPALAPAPLTDSDSSVMDAEALDRALNERARARRDHNVALIKTLGMVLGVCLTLASVGSGIWAWTRARMLADFEQQREVDDQSQRLDAVEAQAAGLAQSVGDIERVMELERVERQQEQRMLEMILTGQGQTPPEPSRDVQAATEEIREILED